MAVGRYFRPQYNNPISLYTPRPFDELYAVGQNMEKKYDKKLADLDSSTDPFSKLNLNASLKVYDPNTPGGIKDYNLGDSFNSTKNQIVDSLTKERSQIVDDYLKDHDTNKFNLRTKEHMNKATKAYSALSGMASTAENIRKQNEEVVKNKQFGTDKAYGQGMLAYNTNFVKDLENGNLNNYTGVGIADEYKEANDLDEHAKNFHESGSGQAWVTENGQYIKDNNWRGVSTKRVEDYADSAWNSPSSTVRNYALMRIDHDIAIHGDNPDREINYTENIPYKTKDGKVAYKQVEKKTTLRGYQEMQAQEHFKSQLVNKVAHQVYEEHLKGDPYGEINARQKAIEDGVHSTIGESGVNTYKTVPESLKNFIGKDGNLTLESIKEGINKLTTNQIYVPGIGYKNQDDLPKGWKITKPMSKEGTQYLEDPSGHRTSIQYKTITSEQAQKDATEAINKEVNGLADRYGITGSSFTDIANQVFNVLNKNAVTVSQNPVVDHDVAQSVVNDLVGNKNQASKLHFVDIYDTDHKSRISGQEFLTKNDIDKNSLNFIDYDFTAADENGKPLPGTKTFSGTQVDKDGKPVSESTFRVTTKNVTERNHFTPGFTVIQNLQKYNQNKPVDYHKDPSGAIMIGEPIKDFDGSDVQAVYSPETKEQYIAVRDQEGHVKLMTPNDYKVHVTDSYYKVGGGRSHLRGISNKYLNLQGK